MPNHVKNIVRLDGDKSAVMRALEAISESPDQLGMIDFNKIIPMPESLNIESGSITPIAIEAVMREMNAGDRWNFSDEKYGTMPDNEYSRRVEHCGTSKEKLLEMGLQYITNKVRYGHTTWYDWCIERWGTKWNAYDRDGSGEDKLVFHTAWSAPHPIIEKVADMFPDIRIEHDWADEDIGNNCGSRTYGEGWLLEETFPNDGRDSIEFACNVWGYDVDDYIAELEADGNEVV